LGIINNSKHGMTGTPTWNSWYSMVCRCSYPSQTVYKYYGGRGIKVCDRWLGRDGFSNFLADMGERPDGMTLDRRERDGDYTPDNCRWRNHKQQMRNQRRTTYAPCGTSLQDLAEQAGIPIGCVRQRMDRLGWSLELALSVPKKHNGSIPMPNRPKSRHNPMR
jgi:hypothetical protein